MKTIGILGGMGPAGTAELYMKIVKYFQKNFDAKYDKEFPPFIIFSVPIPDVVESVENEKIILKMLKDAARKLEENDCDFIIIACNTVQYLLDDIRESVKIPILGIAEVNAEYVNNNKKTRRIGILGTKTMIEKGVYEKPFKKIGVELIKPDKENQDKLTGVIMNILAGKNGKKEKSILKEVIDYLKNQCSEAILIACTDLPLLITQKDDDIPIIDCTQVYADKAAELSIFK